jgi:hypothetical protein
MGVAQPNRIYILLLDFAEALPLMIARGLVGDFAEAFLSVMLKVQVGDMLTRRLQDKVLCTSWTKCLKRLVWL